MRDNILILSDEQEVIETGEIASTGLDCTSALADIGTGTSIFLTIEAPVAVVDGEDSTIKFSLQDSADDTTYATVLETPVMPIGDDGIDAGLILKMRLPKGLRRYLRVLYTIASDDSEGDPIADDTEVLDTGIFNAYLEL